MADLNQVTYLNGVVMPDDDDESSASESVVDGNDDASDSDPA